MRPRSPLLLLATALAAVACDVGRTSLPEPASDRLESISEALHRLADDPHGAVAALADAGPGATLERARFEAWIEALRSSRAAPDLWRDLVDARPPRDLLPEAVAAWGEALMAQGRTEQAVDVLGSAADLGSRSALEHLLRCDDPSARERAALRLAVVDPGRLGRAAPELERAAVATLAPEQWLQRARSWLDAGAPRRAAAELAARRWRGDVERSRRVLLASALTDSGSPSRALATLPALSAADAPEAVARAQACRQLAWGSFPQRGSRTWFERSLAAAQRALTVAGADAEQRQQALALVAETSTELGRLDQAWEAWSDLAASRWDGPRRSWLGRRLGVAIASSGASADRVLALADQLAGDERCLRFWAVPPGPAGEPTLRALASAPVADVYGRWAREELGLAPPVRRRMAPPAGRTPPPVSVGRLLDWGATRQARQEWRRLRHLRGATPGEALAAAALEAGAGSANEAIRWLLAGAPELNTVNLLEAPSDLVLAYLPLRWAEELKAAAAEAGLDPWLLAAVARQESVFTAHARSPRGATGVVQLMPATARLHARALGLGSQPDLLDPGVNLRLGARELAGLIARYRALEPALAAYNAGDARTRRWWQIHSEPRRFVEMIPIPETYTYVRRVVFLSEAYRLVYAETWEVRP